MSILLFTFLRYFLVIRYQQTSARLPVFCYLLVIGFTLPVTAQITINNSVFPVVGDTLHFAFGNQPGAINQIFTPPGGPQAWDLTGLQPTQIWNQIIQNPASGSAQASFPGASTAFCSNIDQRYLTSHG